ncbi:MAG: hypothetical protein ACOCWB_02600 [Bacteroidota bacterium]
MKMFPTLLFLCCSFQLLYSQKTTATLEEVSRFSETTTYVIKQNDLTNEYNTFIQEAFEKYWDISDFELISYSEFEEKRQDEHNSFVLLTNTGIGTGTSFAEYKFVSVLMGGDFQTINEMPEVCSFPLMATDDESGDQMVVLPAIIQFLNNHIKNMQSNPALLKDSKFKYYTKQKRNFTSKKLYLIKENQTSAFQTKKAITDIYPHPVSFVEYSDIADAIAENKENIVFHLKVSTQKGTNSTRCYTIIMGCDGKLYYFNYHTIKNTDPTNGILAKEWKKFTKYTQ